MSTKQMSFGRTMLAGVISGAVGAFAAYLAYLAFAGVFAYEVVTAGQEMTRLYVVPIFIASIIANLIGALIYYLLVKKSKRPVLIYAVIVAAAALLNSGFSQTALSEEYRMIAHIVHAIVAAASIMLLPRLTNEQK